MQDHRQKRIQKNFRDAQRLRMKREAAEKVKMESDAEEAPRLRRRVYDLEHQRVSQVQLPPRAMSQIMDHAMDQAARALAREMKEQHFSEGPWVDAVYYAAKALYAGSLPLSILRGDDDMRAQMYICEQYMPEGYECTLKVPEFRWTHILDRHTIQSMGGNFQGPILAKDGPIAILRESPSPGKADEEVSVEYI